MSRNSSASGAGRRGCLALVFAVFLVAGLFFSYHTLFKPLWLYQSAASWVETPCTILRSSVQEMAGDDGATYRVSVAYAYQYGGVNQTGNRYDLTESYSSDRQAVQAAVERLRPDTKAVCYVDPERPTLSVLNRDLTGAIWLGTIPLVFVAVGAGGLFVVFFLSGSGAAAKQDWLPPPAMNAGGENSWASAPANDWGRASSAPWAQPEQAAASIARPSAEYPDDESDDDDDDDYWNTDYSDAVPEPLGSGPVTLKPKNTPVGGFVAILVVTLFWNGIISFFVWHVVSGILRGKIDWCPTLFCIPFVLVGVGLLFATVHAFLATFNPRPTLMLGNGLLRLGDTLEVAWQFTGNTHAIRRLTLELRGHEEATYRRGTSTYTDRETFASLPLFDTSVQHEVVSGKASVQIPRETMHSFEAAHNKVIWMLVLVGDIAFWPNVSANFPVTVLPLEVVKG